MPMIDPTPFPQSPLSVPTPPTALAGSTGASTSMGGAQPPWLQQQKNPSFAGQMNNMVRALMAGASKPQVGGAPVSQPVSQPMSIQSPQATWPAAGTSGVPFTGAPQNSPTMNALFSRPPSPFGAGSENAIY